MRRADVRRRALRASYLVIALLLAYATLFPQPALAQAPVPGACHDGTLPGGALSRICVPESGWNGGLLVFAHGYVSVTEPVDFQHLTLPDGTNIPQLAQALGFAFATTSYRQNGLAVLEGLEDVTQLVAAFEAAVGQRAAKTIIAGVSEGGLIAALAAERAPQVFDGALSTCGPIGSFRGQVDYVGDLRVLFDFYYPGVIPGPATDVPAVVRDLWAPLFVPVIRTLVEADPARALELLRVARAPFDPADPSTIAQTVINVLWYNVFGTNDAVAKLGGNPFDNSTRWYAGSGNDAVLNALVQRHAAAPAALASLQAYETSGAPGVRLVTLHTVADEVIPFGHQIIYGFKVDATGSRERVVSIPIGRYGHCQFTTGEVLTGLAALITQP
jgi:pimeloyl-ACP methyl ester carboxylesterase